MRPLFYLILFDTVPCSHPIQLLCHTEYPVTTPTRHLRSHHRLALSVLPVQLYSTLQQHTNVVRALLFHVAHADGVDKHSIGEGEWGIEGVVGRGCRSSNPSSKRFIRSSRTLIRTPTHIYLLLGIRPSFSVRGRYGLHTSSRAE